jgi:hypothetical protein
MSLQDDVRRINDDLDAKMPHGSRMRSFDIVVTTNALGECMASAVCSRCQAQMGSIIDIGASTSSARAVDSVWSALSKWTREHVALCARAK